MARPKKIEDSQRVDPLEEIAAKENELAEMKKSVKYNFQKQAQRLHSLYKLATANFKKNTSFTSTPSWVDVEHTHCFH